MNTTVKHYIGNIGWSGAAKHIIKVNEVEDGTGYTTEPFAVCKPNTGFHYRIGRITQLRRVAATVENVTCKDCLKILGQN